MLPPPSGLADVEEETLDVAYAFVRRDDRARDWEIDAQRLAAQLVEQTRRAPDGQLGSVDHVAKGVDLVGPNGLLTGLTKTVSETALEAELSDHSWL